MSPTNIGKMIVIGLFLVTVTTAIYLKEHNSVDNNILENLKNIHTHSKPLKLNIIISEKLEESIFHVYALAAVQKINDKFNKKLQGYQVNLPHNENKINFFFIQPEDTFFKSIVNNCAYVGYNSIVCDISFIKTLTSPPKSRLLIDTPIHFSQTLMPNFYELSVLWVIGHELGHLAYNHDMQHFSHPDLAPEESSTDYNGLIDKVLPSYKGSVEEQADSFSLENISSDKSMSWAMKSMTLMGICQRLEQDVEKIITKLYNGDRSKLVNKLYPIKSKEKEIIKFITSKNDFMKNYPFLARSINLIKNKNINEIPACHHETLEIIKKLKIQLS